MILLTHKMNYLFHSSLPLSTPSRAIMYDEALRLAIKGAKVNLLYCNGLMSQCFINICGNTAQCSLCKSHYRSDQRRFGKQINFVPMTSLLTAAERNEVASLQFSYNNVNDIKQLNYKGINIGYGVISGYITCSRNMNPQIDAESKAFFDENLKNAVLTIIAVRKMIEQQRPDHIYLYNGRFADSRPIWEIAQQENIPYTTLEAIYGVNRNFRAKFENSTSFSIDKNRELINQFWNKPGIDKEQKIKIGSSFFERRRNAQYCGDKIYTAGQQQGLLPNHWDSSKHNLVIFNSSEDEFAAIGDEYEQKALFKSQLDGLIYIKDLLRERDDIQVTLRIHPNLNGIPYSYATDLYRLRGDRFDIIESGSPVSTYSLIDAADTVIVFGSTAGVESVFWGKPTILLAGALYYHLDICYIPSSPAELNSLLTRKLEPKDREGAIRYGYFLMNEKWESPAALDFNWSYRAFKLLGKTKKLELNNWLTLFGSRKLYALMQSGRQFICHRILGKLKTNGGNKFTLPSKEAIPEQ